MQNQNMQISPSQHQTITNQIELNQQIIPQIPQQPINTTQPLNQSSSFSSDKIFLGPRDNFFSIQNPILWVIFVIVMFIVFKLVRRKKTEKKIIYLVGQRGAGKTRLLYKLNQAKNLDTVPSIKNNVTNFKLPQGIKQMIDVTGDNHSKQQFLANLGQAFCIIQVVDGSNSDSLSGVAQLLYRILISKAYKKQESEYCIFLNKNDKTNYIGANLFRKKIEQQIERIKLSKRSVNQQNQLQDDHLREQKVRFNLEANGVNIIEGSVLENKLAGVNKFIEDI